MLVFSEVVILYPMIYGKDQQNAKHNKSKEWFSLSWPLSSQFLMAPWVGLVSSGLLKRTCLFECSKHQGGDKKLGRGNNSSKFLIHFFENFQVTIVTKATFRDFLAVTQSQGSSSSSKKRCHSWLPYFWLYYRGSLYATNPNNNTLHYKWNPSKLPYMLHQVWSAPQKDRSHWMTPVIRWLLGKHSSQGSDEWSNKQNTHCFLVFANISNNLAKGWSNTVMLHKRTEWNGMEERNGME